MFIHKPRPHEPHGGDETPRDVALNRRAWLKRAGWVGGTLAAGAAGYALWNRNTRGTDDQVIASGRADAGWTRATKASVRNVFPAPRNPDFTYGRPETDRLEAARYTNFYEFSRFKWCWKHVGDFRPYPWTLVVDGLCRNPLKLDMDQLHRRFAKGFQERQYRHRCVETWTMAVPWSGFPLAELLKAADPLAKATHVRFVSFERPDQAPNQIAGDEYPWPYTEGLTLPEAMNDLTLLATGMYGEPLLKQHGAPVRLVVPWKYGYKSIKSIARIELLDREPPTFWNTLAPQRYPFESNVEPAVPRPWDQSSERMLGSNERYPTRLYNGYGDWVRELYEA